MKPLVLNFMASAFGKVSASCVRLIEVPLLLSGLGVEEYGRWLLLSSIPAWLAIANLGFGSVASNEMSMRAADGDLQTAKSVYSTTCIFLVQLTFFVFMLAIPIAFTMPWSWILDAESARHNEFVLTAILLTLSVLLSFFVGLFAGRFLAAGKAHVAITLSSCTPWINLAFVAITLTLTKRFDCIAASMLVSSIVLALLNMYLSFRCMPKIKFCRSSVDDRWRALLIRKGLAFQAFPIGNAVLFQGNLFIVQAFTGPTGVALFATARTLVRSVNQAMEMVNQSVWPELSLAIGGGRFTKAANLHRFSVALALLISLPAAMVLMIWGPSIYAFWTQSTLILSSSLIFCFMLPIPFNALWYTSSVVHAACNQHEGLAIRYLLATILSALACIALTSHYGLYGAALSTLVVDVALIPYVIKRSLRLTSDNFSEFYVAAPKQLLVALQSLFARLKTKCVSVDSL